MQESTKEKCHENSERGSNEDPISPAYILLAKHALKSTTQIGSKPIAENQTLWLEAYRRESDPLICFWSGRPGSNRRHPAWEAGVLPLNYSRSNQARCFHPQAIAGRTQLILLQPHVLVTLAATHVLFSR